MSRTSANVCRILQPHAVDIRPRVCRCSMLLQKRRQCFRGVLGCSGVGSEAALYAQEETHSITPSEFISPIHSPSIKETAKLFLELGNKSVSPDRPFHNSKPGDR